MGSIRIGQSLADKQKLVIDGTFVTEYMPSAPENYVKIYLTGLYLALCDPDCNMETVALRLFCNEQTVSEAFTGKTKDLYIFPTDRRWNICPW